MEEVLFILRCRLLKNISLAASWYVVPNLLAGILLAVCSCFVLYRESRRKIIDFTFSRRDMLKVFIPILAGAVFVLPLFPLKDGNILVLLSPGMVMLVLIITSVMDEKSRMFILGYLFAGTAVQIIACAAGCISGRNHFSGGDICMLLAAAAVIVGLGFFGYSPGDAGLFLMALLSYMTVLDTWQIPDAVLTTLFVSCFSFIVRFLFHVREEKAEKRARKPFTLCVTIGVLYTYFLYLM